MVVGFGKEHIVVAMEIYNGTVNQLEHIEYFMK